MVFQLEGLVERTLKEKKELSEFVNNYYAFHPKLLTDCIYNTVVHYLQKQYLSSFAIGASYTALFKLIIDEAQKNQNQPLNLFGIFGLGVFGSYTLINVIRWVELETNAEEISRQSREYAQEVIRKSKRLRVDIH